MGRLFTVRRCRCLSYMLIVVFDGPPSWFLDASGTGENTKFPWVETVGLIASRRKKIRGTVTSSLRLMLVAPATATADWSNGQ